MLVHSHRSAVVVRPDIPPGRRVLAVSDIHGNLPFLKGALHKANYSADDVLILVGDLLEKGPDSLGVLRYVMDLQATREVYALCGNCDNIDRDFLMEPELDQGLWPLFRLWRNRMTLLQMGAELGLPPPDSPADLPTLRKALWQHFPAECQFLASLPHILVTGRYLFVHGGIPREDNLEELDAYGCMKDDDFLGQNRSFQRWVVVGHWPVTLYHSDIQSSQPIVLSDRHIISIDGGCVLKRGGQLNVLQIPDVTKDDMSFVSYDGLPRVTALDHQQPSADPINIRWSDSVVDLLAVDGDSSQIRHRTSGRILWVPTSYLGKRWDGLLHTEDATDYLLPVAPGDQLSLVASCSKGHVALKNGVCGWYLGRF